MKKVNILLILFVCIVFGITNVNAQILEEKTFLDNTRYAMYTDVLRTEDGYIGAGSIILRYKYDNSFENADTFMWKIQMKNSYERESYYSIIKYNESYITVGQGENENKNVNSLSGFIKKISAEGVEQAIEFDTAEGIFTSAYKTNNNKIIVLGYRNKTENSYTPVIIRYNDQLEQEAVISLNNYEFNYDYFHYYKNNQIQLIDNDILSNFMVTEDSKIKILTLKYNTNISNINDIKIVDEVAATDMGNPMNIILATNIINDNSYYKYIINEYNNDGIKNIITTVDKNGNIIQKKEIQSMKNSISNELEKISNGYMIFGANINSENINLSLNQIDKNNELLQKDVVASYSMDQSVDMPTLVKISDTKYNIILPTTSDLYGFPARTDNEYHSVIRKVEIDLAEVGGSSDKEDSKDDAVDDSSDKEDSKKHKVDDTLSIKSVYTIVAGIVLVFIGTIGIIYVKKNKEV